MRQQSTKQASAFSKAWRMLASGSYFGDGEGEVRTKVIHSPVRTLLTRVRTLLTQTRVVHRTLLTHPNRVLIAT
jgi:hypothetical protein